jgi:hypothetical protein
MRGTFRAGDCLSVAPASMADIHPGDVVVYRRLNHWAKTDELVHRVVAVVPGGLVAQGDNNPCADTALVTADNLLGRVTHVERGGKTWPVRGGRVGLLRARLLHAPRPIWRLITRVGRGPYRWLRESGLIARLWQPSLLKMRLVTENGPLVKYVCRGRTVAHLWPAEGRFECRKPYDLVLQRDDLLVEHNADTQG